MADGFCHRWETVPMDVAGGAFIVVEGVQREYKLKETVWRPSVLLGLALAIGIAIALLVYLLGTYWPLVFIWAPFVLIGIASATVTRVERTAKAFMIASGLNDAWQLAIAARAARSSRRSGNTCGRCLELMKASIPV